MRLSRKLILILLLVSLVPLVIAAAISKSTFTQSQHEYSAARLQGTTSGAILGSHNSFAILSYFFNTFTAGLAAARPDADARAALLRDYSKVYASPLILRL